ncbi:hypothetical protein N0V82_007879 [Gnomoniopsis sp. IMI 355080]|nr:hypothetical protein N0V82_007879 [Gnomoniopsis sp. IMI 355080]
MSEAQPSRVRRAAKRRKTSPNSGPPTMTDDLSSDGVAESAADAGSALAISNTDSSISNDSLGEQPTERIDAPDAAMSDHESLSTSTVMVLAPAEEPSSHCWPAERIPVEIFNLIIQFLPRKAVQTMRLVNREFDSKLAEIYFKSVVVPFRPEFEALYGSLNIDPGSSSDKQRLSLVIGKTSDETGLADDTSPTSANDGVLSAGHRVFEQFGDKMRKFALALELNERDLATPPLKINQEILLAPWGLYRWPIMNYQRYSRVEGLEQMANETGYMLKAFQYLRHVTEIGISCDAGLGWLCGPDTNPFCARTLPPVFRPIAYEGGGAVDSTSAVEEEEESLSLSILKQMALNAGYSETEWPRVILRLLEDEGREGVVEWIERILPSGRLTRDRIPYLEVNESTPKEDILLQIKNAIACDGESTVVGTTETRNYGLIPSLLSMAQTEMLLELEWAHRALMQSYRIAVMDNKNSFQNLKQLTIARCPSCRIKTWCDDQFWETMTSIETFHLGVIPDWREITKNRSGAIEQRNVAPSNASRAVFKLLQYYVAEQKNIKNLSFEWVCGGEFAMGKSQRDRYILPAPVLSDIGNMVNVLYEFQADDILNLPYVSRLALKNCWFAPHVFTFFFKHMFLEALEHVILESVSLTGPPTSTPELSIYPGPQFKPSHWPWPLCVGAEPGNWFQLQRPQNNNQAPVWQGVHVMPLQLMPMHVVNANVANPPATQGQGGVVPPGGAFQPINALHPGNIGFMAQPNQPAPGVGPVAAMHAALQNHNAAVPVNHLTAPAQQSAGVRPNRWRAWSWPHILACLGMAPVDVAQHLHDSSAADKANLVNAEKRFAAKFKAILEDRVDNGNYQQVKFKSCGYALIDSPSIDNWTIIPDHAIQVQQSAEFVNRLKDLDNSMLTTQDAMLAKIINYMPDEEGRQLRNLFDFELGWDDLYDPIVKQAAIADGNPHPGQARFFGEVNNKPRGVCEKETVKYEGKFMRSANSPDIHGGDDCHVNEANENERVQVELPDAENAQDAGEGAESIPASSGPDEDDIYSSGDPVDQTEVGGGSSSSAPGSSERATSLDSATDVNKGSSADNGSQTSTQSVQNVATGAMNHNPLYGLTDIREPSVQVPDTNHNWSFYMNPLTTPMTSVAGISEGEEEQGQEQEQDEAAAVVQHPRSQYDDDWYPYNPDRNGDDDVGW